jgi:hypothetical protein
MKKLIILLLIIPTVSAQIEITEIMYDVPGSDAGREWIEIHNTGNTTDLTGWRFFESGSNHKLNNYTNDLILEPNEYAVIVDKPELFLNDTNFTGTIIDSSWPSLTNKGEPLVLKTSKNGTVIVNITYIPLTEADGNGASLQLINNSWQACNPTPGQENFCQEPNQEEEIEEKNQTEIIEETTEEPTQTEIIEPQTEFNLKEIETLEIEENKSEIIQIELPTQEIIPEPKIENKLVKLAYESENKGFVIIGFYLFLLASLALNIIQLISK